MSLFPYSLFSAGFFYVFLQLGVVGGSAAQSKDLEVVPANQAPAVKLTIDINKSTVAIGDMVEFTFTSSVNGYVTLWDVGTSGKVTRLYPNPLGGDMKVQAGVRYGAGRANESFAFRAKEPPGMEDVYLLWTRQAEAQPKQATYRDATALANDLASVQGLRREDWATAKVTFEITPSSHPSSAVIPPPRTIIAAPGQTYILALGANVKGLTKANADVRNFGAAMQPLLQVPPENSRFVENARRRDFAEGMEWLQSRVKPDDLVLLFFSGHGSTIKDDDGDESDGLDEVFVMYDANGVERVSARHIVRDDEFAAWVNRLASDRVITFIDACHSGGLSKELTGARIKFFVGGELGRAPVPGAIHQAKGPVHEDLPGGIDGERGPSGLKSVVKGVVYAASQEDQYALEVADGGLFITRLLQHVSRGQTIALGALFTETREAVQTESKGVQTPVAVGETRLGASIQLTAAP